VKVFRLLVEAVCLAQVRWFLLLNNSTVSYIFATTYIEIMILFIYHSALDRQGARADTTYNQWLSISMDRSSSSINYSIYLYFDESIELFHKIYIVDCFCTHY